MELFLFLFGCAVGAASVTYIYWYPIKAQTLAWYDKIVSKI